MNIRDYATVVTDEEQASKVRMALAEAAIARAKKEQIPGDENLDESLDRVLGRVSQRAVDALTIHASSPSELKKALEATLNGEALLPPRVALTAEEEEGILP